MFKPEKHINAIAIRPTVINVRYSKVAAKSCLLKFLTSAVSSSKTTGVWAVR